MQSNSINKSAEHAQNVTLLRDYVQGLLSLLNENHHPLPVRLTMVPCIGKAAIPGTKVLMWYTQSALRPRSQS